MKQFKVAGHLVFGIMFFVMPGITAAELSTDPIEELKSCARTTDGTARIACYEALGKRVLSEEDISLETPEEDEPADVKVAPASASAAVPASASASVPAPAPAPLPATAAAPAAPNPRPDEISRGDDLIRGHIRSCREAAQGGWFFYLDSGQVWKKSSGGRHRFKNCDFDVTITKDRFGGYKMTIDGGRTFRVRLRK